MTAPQQPGPSFEPPAYPPPGQQRQGPPGLPPQDKSAPRRGPRPIIILVSAVLAVALLISAGMMIGRELLTGDGAVSATEDATAISGQLLPPNATDGHGILIGGVAPSEDLPHVIIWEDPQCPACAHYENSFGPVIAELVAAGELTAEARFAYFLDREEADGPSLRAAIAMAAPIHAQAAGDAPLSLSLVRGGAVAADPVVAGDRVYVGCGVGDAFSVLGAGGGGPGGGLGGLRVGSGLCRVHDEDL